MILNLTQHLATPDQLAEGVVDLTGFELEALQSTLTFKTLPTTENLQERADFIASLAAYQRDTENHRFYTVMIGGAPYFMRPLILALKSKGIHPVFAFSTRETEEVTQADGTVKKIAYFHHTGWVDA